MKRLSPPNPQPFKVSDLSALCALAKGEGPPGYRQFLQSYGPGTISGWLEILPPSKIVEDHAAFRQRLKESWRWEPAHAMDVPYIRLAETMNTDELVWAPATGYQLLPADEEQIVALGEMFDEALERVFTLHGRPPLRVFADASVEFACDEFELSLATLEEVLGELPMAQVVRQDSDQPSIAAVWLPSPPVFVLAHEDDGWIEVGAYGAARHTSGVLAMLGAL